MPSEGLVKSFENLLICEAPRFSFSRVIRAHRQGQKQSLYETFKYPPWNETPAKDIVTSSQQNRERCQEEILKNLDENAHLQGTRNLHAIEDAVWYESIKEVKEQEKNLQHSSIQREQVVRDQDNQLKSLSQNLLKVISEPAVSGEVYKDAVSLELDEKSSSMNGGLQCQTKVDLTKLNDCVRSSTALDRLEKERQRMPKDVHKQNHINEELTSRIKHLENEQRLLQQNNEQLENTIEKLQHTLRIFPEVRQLYQESVQQKASAWVWRTKLLRCMKAYDI